MPGPRSICPAPAGSASTPPRACCAARAIFRSPRRRITAPPRRSPAWSSRARSTFGFEMSVTRIAEQPRVTMPFSDEAWAALDALGDKVDADLQAHDVRLTMGGEPTFVSVDDYQSAEWNTDAVGPTKRDARRRSDPPAARPLRAGRAAALRPGQMVSGRAAAALGLRALLAPRRRADLAGRKADRASRPTTTSRPPPDARRFAEGIAARLGIAADYVQPAYEDPADRMIKQGLIPDNIDPTDPKIDDPARARAHSEFVRELSRPAGGLRAAGAALDGAGEAGLAERSVAHPPRSAVSGAGRFAARLPAAAAVAAVCRAGRLSASGAGRSVRRAPALAGAARHRFARFALAGNAPWRRTGAATRCRRPASRKASAAARGRDRMAACRCARRCRSKSRDGRLCVFMPPVETLDGLSRTARDGRSDRGRARPAGPCRRLCAAARSAAQRHQSDARSRRHRGQHPSGGDLARSRRHHARRSTRTPHLARLGTDKFMLDGRHTGTGGGNHVVLGGLEAADSPFLRRPDLLKSLVLYWQRQPSLSYLFSGLFIGPTSQAPRIDEARQDMLYELEIALAQGAAAGRRGLRAAVAGRPAVPQHPGRRHRQHPSRRDLHRQAVFARRPDRPARPGRVPLVRNAAGRAHEPCAAIAAARADRLVLARAARRHAGALGHGAARPLHARAFRLGRISSTSWTI